MNKILLGTTALAATLISGAAMAEEPIKLSLGGYFQAYGIHQNSDLADLRSAYIAQRGRINVKGSTTLDNGLTVGVFTQIRAGEHANLDKGNGMVKRAYAFFEADFGRLEVGAADGAANQLGYTSPDPAPAAGVNSANFFANPASENYAGALGSTPTTYNNWDSQTTKVSYFTPRVAGFQFGVSFTPESCKTGPTTGGDESCPSFGQAPKDNEFQQSEVWQLGANYSNTFGELDLGLSGTFAQGTLEDNFGDINATDRQSYGFGTNLTANGFTLGASYLYDNEGVVDVDVDAWDIGLKYTTGPFSAGVQHIQSTREGDPNGVKYEVRATMIGGGFAVGPGINLGAGYQMWSWDASPLTANTKNDADMFLVGTVLNF
jgi:hypothetical protein